MKGHKCKNCARYRIFYRKTYVRFWKEKIGFCSNKQTVADEGGVCASFEQQIENSSHRLRALDVAIADVEALQAIFDK